MKTLHVDCGRRMQGGQWQVLYLLERLERATLLAPADAPLLQEARARGVDARPLSFASLWRLARNVDVVHAHDSRGHSMAAIARGAPLVVSRRVGFPPRGGAADVAVDFAIGKYSCPRMYLAVSQFVGQRLEKRVDFAKIRVIHDGIPIPETPSDRTAGVVALVKNGAEAKIHGIPVRVVSALWNDLATASVFVYLSDMEGLGSAAIAAMACGVPVIASRVGGLPEVVEHERTGLLIDSPGELEPALRRLLENADLAREMGERGREVAKAKFSVETMVEMTKGIYKEVVA